MSVGNPHAVIQVDDPATFPLAFQGPRLEHHEWFPQRANIEVWRPLADASVEMRVWERGVGETDGVRHRRLRGRRRRPCSTALAHSPVTVRLPGGSLEVGGRAPGLEIRMTGPAERLGGAGAVRFARRLDPMPEYLAAQLNRLIAERARPGAT